MTDDGTLDRGDAPEGAGFTGEPPPPPAGDRSGRKIAAVIAAVVVVGAGVGTAVALSSSSSGGASTPSTAVTSLLDAANHSDVLGALDSLVPGERQAIEPGLSGLVGQLQRLHVLSSGADLSGVDGIGLHFSKIVTRTQMLTPTLAAVTIGSGSITASVTPRQLPLGSFVRGFVSGQPRPASKTSSASTGHSAVVTELIGGHWYVSLGYTIAADVLRGKGGSGDPPPPDEAIAASGASSPQGAVSALFRATAALNIAGLIGDLPPGEMGALQRYAPLFLNGDRASLAKARSQVKIEITSLSLSTSPALGGTLVEVKNVGFSGTFGGVSITFKNGCITETRGSITQHECAASRDATGATKAQQRAVKEIVALLPRNVRAVVSRFEHSHASFGLVTVEEGGRWYVSPLETMLDDLDSFLAIPQAQDLVAIEQLIENPTELRSLERAIERIEGSEIGALGRSFSSVRSTMLT